uniref:GT23 domain-containing protein n=1 Tax=Meloidogyne hapla TaxID=6305 RepID=A0A1I8BV64_MELHA
MTLIQKQIYLRKLFGYDLLKNVEQKQLIERQIISHLSREYSFYIKPRNEQKLSIISEKIQSAINLLQNPINCSNASILVCPEWVEFWFDVVGRHNQNEAPKPNCTNRRILFIASDLPILKDIVEETISKWGDKYEIYHGTFNTQCIINDSKEALIEILAVFRILAKCQFLVCTFSSNACQLIYELMQAYQGDAIENVQSLDYIYEMSKHSLN